jgi:NAD(P)-dependent dehydrogenase (short-subunit alcohol dehydrogenase family)
MRLANKVALITGGTSGIGRATALLFSQEGAKVSITGRNESRGQEVIKKIKDAGGEAIFIKADVRISEECRQTVEKTLQAFSRIDILFNNAGVYFPNTVVDCTEKEWNLTLDINLKGTYLMSKFTLPAMIAQGSGVIINNSSGWGLVGGNEAAAYCASKGGVVLMTRAMAIDHSPQGIRINCICPGDVDTPMLAEDARQRRMSWKEYLVKASNRPLLRIGESDEIAKAALFLASEDSSFMTGAILAVDGGGTAD